VHIFNHGYDPGLCLQSLYTQKRLEYDEQIKAENRHGDQKPEYRHINSWVHLEQIGT
jgi:hypothetical protein